MSVIPVIPQCQEVTGIGKARGGVAYWDLTGPMPQTIQAPETLHAEREERVPLYRVVLLDDNDHTYDYVIEMLQKLFIFTLDQAYRHAEEVDRTGRTVLLTCELSEAEFARDQIHAFGPDWRLPRSKGPMSAVLEPAS